MELKFIDPDEDPIEERLDQMADLLELRKRYRSAQLGQGSNTHVIRDAVLTLTDEIRGIRFAEAGGGQWNAMQMKFSRQTPVDPGWYWLRGKVECDLIVHVYHELGILHFCDGLEVWAESDPQTANYQYAGPIPTGL